MGCFVLFSNPSCIVLKKKLLIFLKSIENLSRIDCETAKLKNRIPTVPKTSRQAQSLVSISDWKNFSSCGQKPSAQCIPEIYCKCKRLHYHMLWPGGTQGSIRRSNLHCVHVKTEEMRPSLIRSVLSTFISGLIFHQATFPTNWEKQGKLVTSILFGMMILRGTLSFPVAHIKKRLQYNPKPSVQTMNGHFCSIKSIIYSYVRWVFLSPPLSAPFCVCPKERAKIGAWERTWLGRKSDLPATWKI